MKRSIVTGIVQIVSFTGALLGAFVTARYFRDVYFFSLINVDAGTYLPLAERLVEGWTPFKDLKFGYTPLALFIFAGARAVFRPDKLTYEVYIGTLLFFEFLTAWMVYLLARTFHAGRALSLFSATLYTVGCSLHEGWALVLEPFVTFFATGAVVVFLRHGQRRWGLFFAGFLYGLAFLTKQYGVLGLFALGLVSLLTRETFAQKFRTLWSLGFGGISALVVYVALMSSMFGVSPNVVVQDAFVPGYLKGLSGMTWLVKLFTEKAPYLLLVPLFILFRPVRTDKIFWVIVTTLAAFALTCTIRDFGHYCILLLPFVAALGAYLPTKLNQSQHVLLRASSILVTCALFPMLKLGFDAPLWEKYPSEREKQQELVSPLRDKWPARTPVLLFGEPWMAFLLDFHPVNAFKGSYSFLSNYSASELHGLIKQSEYILVDRESRYDFDPERLRVEAEYGDFNQVLASAHCLETTLAGRFELWQRVCGRNSN